MYDVRSPKYSPHQDLPQPFAAKSLGKRAKGAIGVWLIVIFVCAVTATEVIFVCAVTTTEVELWESGALVVVMPE
jgi:hypothetical protein